MSNIRFFCCRLHQTILLYLLISIKLQNVTSTTLGHLGDCGRLLPLVNPLYDLHSLGNVREVHGCKLGVDDCTVDSHFKGTTTANFS